MKKKASELKASVVLTALGYVAFSYSAIGIYSTTLPKESSEKALKAIGNIAVQGHPIFEGAIKKFIEGRQKADIKLDTTGIGEFDLKVFSSLKKVKRGTVISYGKLSENAGVEKAARAVGNALNRNRHPLIIPCHRVIKKDGSIGGFAGGVRVKKALLGNEGVEF
jgi:O-6-methylguanine DNA methyltransferase